MNHLKIESPHYILEKNTINTPLNESHRDKKKSIDLCSTNASNKIIPYLSNPTNLTNPLIIKKSNKDDSNENSILSNKEYKINKLNAYNKLIFNISNKKIQTSKSELNLLNQGIKGPIIKTNNKKLLKPIDSKNSIKRINSRNSIFFVDYTPKSINNNIENNNNNILKRLDYTPNSNINSKNKNDKELDKIWEKLKNSKIFNSQEKDVRIDRLQFVHKYDIIDNKKKISLIKNDIKIKNNRYNKIKKLNNCEINALDNMKINLTKSSDYIQKNYQENYVSNVLSLFRQVEKEKIIISNYLMDKNSLIKQISKIENKISKLNEEKSNILKWIYLEIKIKERKTNLPLYYQDIIENKINYDSLIKKYKLKEDNLSRIDYNNIKNYKQNLIFNDINEIYNIFYNLENKIFYDLNTKLNNINNIKKLKNDLENFKKEKENKNDYKNEDASKEISFEEKEKEFIKELKKLKFKNNELNDEYSKIIHYKFLLNDSNKISFYNSNSDKNNIFKFEIKKNENEGNNISNLFNIAMNLYEEEIKAKFNIENKIKWKYSATEEKMILDILIYTEKVINYLFEERDYYNSVEKLKNKYKLIEEEVEKETKNKKLIKQLELQEKLLVARKEKIQMRLNNRNYYKPYRKVDFEYYLREKSKNKNKKIGNKKVDDNYFQYFFY